MIAAVVEIFPDIGIEETSALTFCGVGPGGSARAGGIGQPCPSFARMAPRGRAGAVP